MAHVVRNKFLEQKPLQHRPQELRLIHLLNGTARCTSFRRKPDGVSICSLSMHKGSGIKARRQPEKTVCRCLGEHDTSEAVRIAEAAS